MANCGAGNLIAETNADGNLIRDYVWQDALPIAQVEAGETITTCPWASVPSRGVLR